MIDDRRVHLDFETYSQLNVKDVGAAKYAEHPSTEVLCLGYAFSTHAPQVWTPDDDPPYELFDAIEQRWRFHCWNSGFEMRVWQKVCVERMGWEPVPFKLWRDTSAIAASYSMPIKLETCGEALALDVQKDKRGSYLLNKLSKPRKPTKNNPATRWTPQTAPKDFQDLYEYCRQDVRAERTILHRLPKPRLSKQETKTWRETMRMNDRGFPIDVRAVKRVRALLSEYDEKCLSEVRELTDGKVQTGGQRAKILAWLSGEGLWLSNLQAGTVNVALMRDDLTPNARKMLELRQELSRTSTKKYEAIHARICDDRTVKDNLIYHGAGTGRYAGRGFQIQNLPRDVVSKLEDSVEKAIDALGSANALELISFVYGSPTSFASALIRSMIRAPEGKVLFGADLEGIENRVTVWYAEDPYGIQLFKDGLDQYRTFGKDFYDVEYDDVTYDQRAHSKQIVLGCCFGMAAETFQRTCAQHGQKITIEEAIESVNGYRRQYPEVVRLWSGLSKAATKAIAYPGTTTKYKRIKFVKTGKFLYMKLASKRMIAYYDPKLMPWKMPWGETRVAVTHMGMSQKVHKWERMAISPGRFTENAVQGTARDVLVYGQEKVTEAGYELIGCVHDETISLADEGFGDVEEYERLTASVPPWWDEVPLSANGWTGRRYRKE